MNTKILSHTEAFAAKQLRLAADIAADMKIGVQLQKNVGWWIAHLGSSASARGSLAYETARTTGWRVVTRLGLPLATGGASGTMEGANRGAMEADGISVSIYLEGLPSEQAQNHYWTHGIRCKTLFARQHLLLSGACGVIVGSEGAWGTIFEIGHQLIEMRRGEFDRLTPIAIIDKTNLWDGFHNWMRDKLVARGLWKAKEYDQVSIVRSPEEAVDVMAEHLLQLPCAA